MRFLYITKNISSRQLQVNSNKNYLIHYMYMFRNANVTYMKQQQPNIYIYIHIIGKYHRNETYQTKPGFFDHCA